MNIKHLIIAMAAAATATASFAADTYKIDPTHTFPSFEADHMGISILRGKFTRTEGTVVLDRAAKTGSIDITIDADSIDFGNEKLNKHAKNEDMFDVAKFKEVTYKSKSITFKGDVPVSADGTLTLHGVSKPVTLTINKFKCIIHPMHKKEVCGADASAQFLRTDFGISYAVPPFAPEVKLAIQVEAVKN
ncbi:polyisoprenoid-binding protein [Massilia sp. CCM 8733]|uniref:Polyisoprenoid-binding protein n=1 Tax=Massilia mucilaginosa TaxID=2609282 RepID=A0ABX0NV46_9BURK|nr:YceI family protein [Massilia mucilaginosa]NHZ90700.1 polyisoprenoid-binding protein [Massilia mucilaginosa]